MTDVNITLPHQYKPRFYQLPVLKALDKGYKRVVWVMHRRGGKDLTILNWCIKEIAVGQAKTCWYLFPSYKQAKRVIWDGMTKDGKRFMSHIPEELVKKKNSMKRTCYSKHFVSLDIRWNLKFVHVFETGRKLPQIELQRHEKGQVMSCHDFLLLFIRTCTNSTT